MIAALHAAVANPPPRRALQTAFVPPDQMKVKVERLALLLRGASVAIAVSVVFAILTVAVAWEDVQRSVLLTWAGLLLGLSLARLMLLLRYRPSTARTHALAAFARLHVLAMGLEGALWGALAPIFAVHGILGAAYLPFAIAALTAAAIASAGASWRSVLAFNIPALAPFALAFALSGAPHAYAIAGIVALYAAATAWLAFATQQMVMRAIRLRSRNTALLEALRAEIDAAHEAHKRYRALIESSQDLTLIFSPEGRVVYASPSAHTALDEPASLVGKTTKELFHPEDLREFRTAGEKSLKGLGEPHPLPHVCLRSGRGHYVPLAGKIANMLYVPGVEGFAFTATRLDPREHDRLHAAE